MSYFGRNIDNDSFIDDALNRINSDYGVSVSVRNKAKNLLKFGENPNVGTSTATIWYTGQDQANETFVERNLIDSISSSSTSDAGIGYTMVVEGHKVGDDQTVSSITQSSGTATVTTNSDHDYSVDQYINIEGANETEYNGIRKVVSVPTSTTFTYTVDSGASSPATGTITTNSLHKTFVTQTATLNGQNRVALTTPIARSTRIAVIEQNNAQDTSGEIYVYENTSLTSGKPTDTTKIHTTMRSDKNQTRKGATSLSNSDYWIVTSFRGSILEKTAASADVSLEVRRLGGVFREVEDVSCSSNHNGVFHFNPYLVVPKNADVRLVAIADGAGTDVSGSIQGYLAN